MVAGDESSHAVTPCKRTLGPRNCHKTAPSITRHLLAKFQDMRNQKRSARRVVESLYSAMPCV